MKGLAKQLLLLGVVMMTTMSVYAETDDDDKDDDDLLEAQQEMTKELEQLKASITQLRTEIEQLSSESKVATKREETEVKKESTEAKKKSLYTPQIYGVVMATFNVSTNNGISRFNVRNSRFGIKGQASRDFSYVVQIDFHNQGSVSVLDTYVKYKHKNFDFRFGQQQINLTSDLNRGPSSNFFTTRSLAALYSTAYFGVNSDGSQYVSTMGSRDIGLYASYKFDTKVPIQLSAGMFNGTGINNAQWDNKVNYITRLAVGGSKGLYGAASYYTGQTPLDQGVDIYSGELHYNSDRLFVEGVYQNRVIEDGGDRETMGLMVVQGLYKHKTPKVKLFDYISPALRWDYGSGVGYLNLTDDTVNYTLNFIELVDVHRLSAMVHFGLKEGRVRSRISVGYEKIFMDYNPADFAYNPLMHDKFTVAFIAAF